MHIVFSDFCRRSLTLTPDSSLIDENIISLNDDLVIGPIDALESEIGRKQRVEWLASIYRETTYELDNYSSYVNEDYNKIEEIINNAGELKELHIWCGITTIDVLGTARLLHSLSNTTLKIYLTDFSNLELKAMKGHFFKAKTLVEVNPENVENVEKTFYLLKEAELKKWVNLWESVSGEEGGLRITDEEQKISYAEESYFDKHILTLCKEEFQKPAQIIGRVLVEIDFAVNDSFLNWRLKELVSQKILVAEGKLKDMRDYQVKIVSR
ncbi:DUF3658 domain-containing protein [uncultured Algoriphagus sp.]|uniref:DUF3658 domain-containing protein n=1 Tax=uncultured Algoriphagus sp. TaxID=417365 RepID=UPI0030EDD0A7|tara:strand:+ start:409 stop:1212 length:804 start_codon:yes stop_codon:yes gene_type:complete